MEIHQFFTGSRAVILSICVPLSVTFAFQVYRDRNSLKRILEGNFETHRVFRLAGFVSSFLLIFAHVDFFGVFGVYHTAVGFTLMIAAAAMCFGCFLLALHNSLAAALNLLPGDVARSKHRAKLLLVSVYGLLTVLYIVSYYVRSDGFNLFFRAFAGLATISILAASFTVSYKLRKHGHYMSAEDTEAGRAFDQVLWNKTLTNWLRYTFAQLIVWVGLGVVYIADTISSDGTTIRRSVFDAVDPSKPPGGYAVALPVGVVAFLLILLWRGWMGANAGNNSTTQGGPEQAEDGPADNDEENDIPSIIDTGSGGVSNHDEARQEEEAPGSNTHDELQDISAVVELGEGAKGDGNAADGDV